MYVYIEMFDLYSYISVKQDKEFLFTTISGGLIETNKNDQKWT